MKRIPLLLLTLILGFSGGMPAGAQQNAVPELVEGNTAFAFDLYGLLAQESQGNLVVSPYSISEALSMTYAGADGQTATQMADALHFTLDQDALPPAFQSLDDGLVSHGTAGANPDTGAPARALHIANGLWGEQTFPFDPAFSAQLDQFYGAGLQLTDFRNDPEGSRQQINGWVAEQTEDKIQDIVPADAITPDTRLVLANAIYFYGGWQHTFSESATEDADFHLLDGSTVSVPFMSQTESFSYAQGDGFQVVELPYEGSGFAMTVILPDEGQFETIEAGLDAATLDAALGQLSYTDVDLYLPKFKFDYSAALADSLQALGMTDAFDPNLADFSGMLGADAPEPLVISDVLHKAFIGIDEDGTEAAAATAVIMGAGAAAPPENPLELRIDRPFLFAIRDTQTGAILFLGRVTDPSA